MKISKMSLKKKIFFGVIICVLSFIVFVFFSFFLIKSQLKVAKDKYLVNFERLESERNSDNLTTKENSESVYIVNGRFYFPENKNDDLDSLGAEVTKDKEDKIYFEGTEIKGVDVNSFEIISDQCRRYFKDKNNVYYADNDGYVKKIENADPKTFRRGGGGCYSWFSRDRNNIYFYGEKLDYVSPKIYGKFFDIFGEWTN